MRIVTLILLYSAHIVYGDSAACKYDGTCVLVDGGGYNGDDRWATPITFDPNSGGSDRDDPNSGGSNRESNYDSNGSETGGDGSTGEEPGGGT